jgi:hypothetical protein
MDEEHPAEQKKSRWWPTRRGAMHIFAVLIAAGALLFVLRGYYLEKVQEKPLTVLGAAAALTAVVVLIHVGQQYQWTGFGESRNLGKDVTLLASITAEGVGPCLAVEGHDEGVFETYLECVLRPTLRSGQIVVMDNLSAH